MTPLSATAIKTVVGVIGGLGPDTTAEFYLTVIEGSRPVYPTAYPNIIIDSVPVPYQLEKDVVLHGREVGPYRPLLQAAAKRLEQAGVDFLVMPCNTVHELYNDVQGAVSVPVVSILETTALACVEAGITRVAVLGTRNTVAGGLYNGAIEAAGLNSIPLTDGEIDATNALIYALLSGDRSPKYRTRLLSIMEALKARGADGAILGCTDLQLIVRPSDEDLPLPTVDSMESLVDETIRRFGGV